MTSPADRLLLGLQSGELANSPETGEIYETTSWTPRDLGRILRGEVRIEPPAYLPRTDGNCLIYPGRAHSFFGPSESLKSWVALLTCRSVVEAGGVALYIDFEDDEVSFVERARIVGIPDNDIGASLRYIRPEEPLLPGKPSDWDLDLAERDLDPALVIIDGVSEAFALHGWDAFSATDTAKYHRLLLRSFERAATIEIDHTSKTEGRGQYGSQHKRAGIDGASYEFKPQTIEGKGGHSVVTLTVSKDRHGRVREFARGGTAAVFHLDATTDPANLYLEVPDERSSAEQTRDRVGLWVAENPGSTTRAIRDGVRGGREAIDAALRFLEADGTLRHETGPRGAKRFYLNGISDLVSA